MYKFHVINYKTKFTRNAFIMGNGSHKARFARWLCQWAAEARMHTKHSHANYIRHPASSSCLFDDFRIFTITKCTHNLMISQCNKIKKKNEMN